MKLEEQVPKPCRIPSRTNIFLTSETPYGMTMSHSDDYKIQRKLFLCALMILLMSEILHQFIGSLSHDLQGFVHPRWCRISAINSITL